LVRESVPEPLFTVTPPPPTADFPDGQLAVAVFGDVVLFALTDPDTIS